MKKFTDLVNETLPRIRELFPWDMEDLENRHDDVLLLDVREPYEFEAMRIEGSLNVPRGILETACDWGYEETVPELVEGRDRPIVIICRSGNRSAFAALTMQEMGYQDVYSLKTGLRGWNDYELPIVDGQGRQVDPDDGETYFAPRISREQMPPDRR